MCVKRVRGSIPARAGEPPSHHPSTSDSRVYPRACGGTPGRTSAPGTGRGLSPRVRGNLLRIVHYPDRLRVYPRACGGTTALERSHHTCQGLSPRVRGNRPVLPVVQVRMGSIPARAGEPPGSPGRPGTDGVYPRACGGTPRKSEALWLLSGLSPRVRGNRRRSLPAGAPRGSIPARAGEPYGPPSRRRPTRVYPRACGGTVTALEIDAPVKGLSPRVRGNHTERYLRYRSEGSIPARAGEPRARTSSGAFSGVYPRACGGTKACRFRSALSTGLSPRVRGNLARLAEPHAIRGSIPARAGEPGLYWRT